jgi:hypothetical protein
MSQALDRRVRQYRSRMLIRAWDYRQRRHARGVWFRLRRLLAGARRAFVIDERDAQRLLGEGYGVEPVGREIEPPKTIVRVPADRAATLPSAREVPVKLGGDLLRAAHLALVPFDRRPR